MELKKQDIRLNCFSTDYKKLVEVKMTERIEKINALAMVLSALKDTYVKNRDDKDEMVQIASKLLRKELLELEKE